MRYLLAALLIAAARDAAAQQCSEAEKMRLEEFDKAWSEATNRGDRAQLQAIFADDYQGITPNETQTKTTTIDAAVRAAERTRASGQTPPPTVYDNYVITCTPTSAVVTHRNATTTTVNGREQTAYSRSVHVMEKRGGRWQVVGNSGHPLSDSWLLLYMENDWNEATRKKDAAWFERNVADDATYVSARTGALQTKRELIASMTDSKTVYESLALSELNVRVDGNTAVVTGVNRLRGRDEQGRPFDRRSRFTGTYIKRDGRWQVWAAQGTPIP
jgi:ketosteroid isomerase-like protein